MTTGQSTRLSWPAKAMIAVWCISGACSEADQDKHLPIKQMTAVMLDINVAESYSAMVRDSMHKPGVKNADSLAVYYKAIFAHHKISKEIYDRSLAWYKNNPSEMDSLFNAMSTAASRLQDSVK